MTVAHGGKAVYGASVGILLLEARFPRLPGDGGHAGTWPFPVLYRMVAGATPDTVVRNGAEGVVEEFAGAARELVAAGAAGITTNCGFLVLHQDRLAREDVIAAARRLVESNRDVGAIVLECTNMPPYAADVSRAVGLSVYDFYSLVCWFQGGLRPRSFDG